MTSIGPCRVMPLEQWTKLVRWKNFNMTNYKPQILLSKDCCNLLHFFVFMFQFTLNMLQMYTVETDL